MFQVPRTQRFPGTFQSHLETLIMTMSDHIFWKSKELPEETRSANQAVAAFVKVSVRAFLELRYYTVVKRDSKGSPKFHSTQRFYLIVRGYRFKSRWYQDAKYHRIVCDIFADINKTLSLMSICNVVLISASIDFRTLCFLVKLENEIIKSRT